MLDFTSGILLETGENVFRIESFIASGGLAEVWKATVVSGKIERERGWKEVALKFPLKPELAIYLKQEAVMLDELWKNLPNKLPRDAIALVEIGEHCESQHNGYLIVMRYYDRLSMNRYYKNDRVKPHLSCKKHSPKLNFVR